MRAKDSIRRRWRHSRRGQTLVEFALVLPMLIVLLLGIADFARVFTAGITLEAAARNGAEAAAIERLRDGMPVTPGDPNYYERLRMIAARAACAESRTLPNVAYVPDDPATPLVNEESCPVNFADGSAMNDGPVVAVCVRDDTTPPGTGDEDPHCGDVVPWVTGTVPAACGELSPPWDPSSGGLAASHSVEVRTCYHFTTLVSLNMNLPFGWGISLGDVWLQRNTTFVVDCPPGDVTTC
jgi:hypothetical protein